METLSKIYTTRTIGNEPEKETLELDAVKLNVLALIGRKSFVLSDDLAINSIVRDLMFFGLVIERGFKDAAITGKEREPGKRVFQTTASGVFALNQCLMLGWKEASDE